MQPKVLWNLVYELIMVLLAIVVAINLYMNFFVDLSTNQALLVDRVDMILLWIFIVDYTVRLIKAENRIRFVKSNWIDLVAIMPFDMAFRVFRLARLVRIVKVFRLIRAGVMLRRFFSVPLKILHTNNLGRVLSVTIVLIILGAMGIYAVEEKVNSFGDALWWSIVTTTTVGYGDISPASTGGRIIAVLLMIIGIGTIGMLTGSIATYFLSDKKQNDDLMNLIHDKIGNLPNLGDEEFDELMKLIYVKRGKS